MENAVAHNELRDRYTFADLHDVIAKLVGKQGLVNTYLQLRGILDNEEIPIGNTGRMKLIKAYIVSQCISIFDLDEKQFMSSTIPEYRDGRMACFHLLWKYTKCSQPYIGKMFKWKLHRIHYYCKRCEDRLSVPGGHRSFVQKYSALERSTIGFISKLS